jgi:hypothetical protein
VALCFTGESVAIVRQIIYPVIIIILAIIIRSFLSLPFIEINGEYMSTNEVISHSEANNKVVEKAFLQRAANQENLISPFSDFAQAKVGDLEVFREAFDVVASIADLIIIITVFFVLPATLKRKT